MLNASYTIIKFITHLHLIQILRLIGVPNRYSAVASIEMLATAFSVENKSGTLHIKEHLDILLLNF